MGCIEKSKLGLRIAQFICALVAFSAAGYLLQKGITSSQLGFMTFTGVTGWLITMAYLAVFCLPSLGRLLGGYVELGVAALYALFFMAASAAVTNIRPLCEPLAAIADNSCNAFRTSEAFGWISFFLWSASVAIAVLDIKQGGASGVYGGSRTTPPTAVTTAYSASV